MHLWVFLILGAAAAVPSAAQVAPEANGGTGDNSQMMTPPPVSGQSYPSEVGAEARSNYLRAGVNFGAAYIDNLYAGSTNPASETTYSVFPTIAYDQVTPRQHRQFMYSPGFTFYQPSSSLNEVDQNLNASLEYRLTEHTKLIAGDTFQRSSTAAGINNPVSGIPQNTVPGVVPPFAERLSNTANAQFTWQFSPLGMIGAGGTFGKFDYPNNKETTGLFDSDERGGTAFYNRRLTATQYFGANFAYSQTLAHLQIGDGQTQTQSIYLFYTIYPVHTLSLSLSGGPQHYSASEPGEPTSGSWGPLVIASMGWQGTRTSVAVSYSREVTAGGGLLGAYDSNSTNGSARWLLSRIWSVGASGGYSVNSSVTPLLSFAQTSGRSVIVGATSSYTISQQISARFEYDHVHQNYPGITAISANPNSNREMISINWQITRPLGR